MEKQTVVHSTFVIERHYPAAPERVFAALADPAKKRRWYADVRGLGVEQFEMDFRVGGGERTRYQVTEGPVKGSTITNETTYLDIVANRRVVIAYSMQLGEHRISASLATFELLPDGDGTGLVFTEQGAYFEGADGPQMREEGWRNLLDHFAKEVARASGPAGHAQSTN
ncbi:MAG TPA: SRPBCC family protein [Bryobacteraceae bacterium]|nr:SRPBCC family protein [Bryobacteraceae bacterium]